MRTQRLTQKKRKYLFNIQLKDKIPVSSALKTTQDNLRARKTKVNR